MRDAPRRPQNGAVVEIERLEVRFAQTIAVRDVSLTVAPGEVLALLGPNGAGKTTTIETTLGYRAPSSGTVRVLGEEPIAAHDRIVPRIGAMLQKGAVWPALPAREALVLFASYYERAEDPDELLDLLELRGVARTPWRRLSGGEQQRLSLAASLLSSPEVLFLDEPTAGVDPIGRRTIREIVTERAKAGVGVLLCTHDLSDVEAVADRVVILKEGAVVAEGSLASLTDADATTVRTAPGLGLPALAALCGAEVREAAPGTYVIARRLDPEATAALTAHLAQLGAGLESLRQGVLLEDRYIELVGESAVASEEPPAKRRARRSR